MAHECAARHRRPLVWDARARNDLYLPASHTVLRLCSTQPSPGNGVSLVFNSAKSGQRKESDSQVARDPSSRGKVYVAKCSPREPKRVCAAHTCTYLSSLSHAWVSFSVKAGPWLLSAQPNRRRVGSKSCVCCLKFFSRSRGSSWLDNRIGVELRDTG